MLDHATKKLKYKEKRQVTCIDKNHIYLVSKLECLR